MFDSESPENQVQFTVGLPNSLDEVAIIPEIKQRDADDKQLTLLGRQFQVREEIKKVFVFLNDTSKITNEDEVNKKLDKFVIPNVGIEYDIFHA